MGEQTLARADPVPQSRLPNAQTRRIFIGEVVASATPLLLQTVLGSCVAVCLRDPVAYVGGMNHIPVRPGVVKECGAKPRIGAFPLVSFVAPLTADNHNGD
jgi:hypothetical protein